MPIMSSRLTWLLYFAFFAFRFCECGEVFQKVYGDTKIHRQSIRNKDRSWKKPVLGYNPPSYSEPCNSPDHCDDVKSISTIQFNKRGDDVDRKSRHEEKYEVDEKNFPLNPKGRTGIKGRGKLRRFGPNHKVVVILTRNTQSFDYAGISSTYADVLDLEMFPSEFTDQPKNFTIPQALLDVIEEELSKDYPQENVKEIIDEALDEKKLVYRGYYHSPLNTDNAWLELWLYQIHDSERDNVGLLELKDANKLNLVWQSARDRKDFESMVKLLVNYGNLHAGGKLSYMLNKVKRGNKEKGALAVFGVGVNVFSDALTIASIFAG